MRNKTQKIGITLISILILSFLSLFLFEEYLWNHLIFPQLEGLNLVSTSVLPQENSFFILPIVIGCIPILLFLSDYIVQYKKPLPFVVTIVTILICGILFMSLHLRGLKADYLYVQQIIGEIQNSMSTSSIHAARHLGLGFLIGAIVPTAIFYLAVRNRKS